MTPEFAIQIIREALMTAFWLALPLLAVGFVMGIFVSLIQIVTSIPRRFHRRASLDAPPDDLLYRRHPGRSQPLWAVTWSYRQRLYWAFC